MKDSLEAISMIDELLERIKTIRVSERMAYNRKSRKWIWEI